MNNYNEHSGEPLKNGPLALHIRRLRQFHGDKQMSKQELANLVGLSVRRLAHYESCRELPQAVMTLLTISTALEVPLQDLIAPDVHADVNARVEERREQLGIIGKHDSENQVEDYPHDNGQIGYQTEY